MFNPTDEQVQKATALIKAEYPTLTELLSYVAHNDSFSDEDVKAVITVAYSFIGHKHPELMS